MVGDAGVEPTAFGFGDTGKGRPQNTANPLNLHWFPRLFKVADKSSASLLLILLHRLSRNLTKPDNKVKK